MTLLHAKCTEGLYGAEQIDALVDTLRGHRYDPRTVKDGETFLENWRKDLTALQRQMKNVDPTSIPQLHSLFLAAWSHGGRIEETCSLASNAC